jgi:hypothetical protein
MKARGRNAGRLRSGPSTKKAREKIHQTDGGPLRADRFREARLWGAPVIGPHTEIVAPFGWTGLARAFGRLCGQSLARYGVRFSSVSILPSGLCLEMKEFGSGEHSAAIHAIANEIAQAAPAIEPATGLLTWASLREFARYAASPGAEIYPCPRPEFREQWSEYLTLSKGQRLRCVADIERVREGFPPSDLSDAPFFERWNLIFPPGSTTVAIWGETASHSVADALFAVDRYRRWACGGRGVYRLNRHFQSTI